MTGRNQPISTATLPFQGRTACSRPLRIAMYSPGIVGLGHTRRNLLIAQSLAGSDLQPCILMIAESRQANVFAMPDGVDSLTLPAFKKVNGACRPRYLDIPLEELTALRSQTIRAAVQAFMPDVLIVDNLPLGALQELVPTLDYLHSQGACCILGLRDILDDPGVIREEWRQAGNENVIRARYDALWVYGDPSVYDVVAEYGFANDIAAKIQYTGYLDQSERAALVPEGWTDPLEALGLMPDGYALCLVGGGQDGAPLAEAFANAVFPDDMSGVIVTGPFMPQEATQRLHCYAATNPRLHVVDFIAEPTLLLRHARRVIGMGGYNTTLEILSYEKRALLVPRVSPRREQMIRAELLASRGLIDILHPDAIDSAALSGWLARDIPPLTGVRDRIDLNGLMRLPRLLKETLILKETLRNSHT